MSLPPYLDLDEDEIDRVCELLCDIYDGAWWLALCIDRGSRIDRLFVFAKGSSNEQVGRLGSVASGGDVDRIVLVHPAGGESPWNNREIEGMAETLGVGIQSEEFTRRSRSC